MSAENTSKTIHFDQLLTFPHLFIFRIVGYADDTLMQRCVDALEACLNRKIVSSEQLPSRTGRFVRIHIGITTLNGDEIYAGYDAIKSIDGVRMAL